MWCLEGGVIILMSLFVKHENLDKKVYGFDSFRGLPKPDTKYPADSTDIHYTFENLSVSKKAVIKNLLKYDVNLNDVTLVEGYFSDTTAKFQPNKIAILRLDGDMYESTWTCLKNLYSKVSLGGFVIIDDYNIPQCKLAVEDFIKLQNLEVNLVEIDSNGIYFEKIVE